MITVAIAGDGQLARGIAHVLADRDDVTVSGPFTRDKRHEALDSGADVVVVATTTRLTDVIADVRAAIESGANVLVSAEEAAFPQVVDAEATKELDALARERGVTVLGCGLNPGFVSMPSSSRSWELSHPCAASMSQGSSTSPDSVPQLRRDLA